MAAPTRAPNNRLDISSPRRHTGLFLANCSLIGSHGGVLTTGRPDPAHNAHPMMFFALILPYGISSGVATILLPFLMTRAGLPVALTAFVVGVALLPNVGRAALAPVVDLTLTLGRWYVIGLVACAATLLLLTLMPIRLDAIPLLLAIAFMSQVCGNLVMVPVGGMMARAVPAAEQGRAAGWFQAGNLGGAALGGGGGVWLATHVSPAIAGAVLAAIAMVCGASVRWLPRIPPAAGITGWAGRFRAIGTDLVALVRSPELLLVTVVVMSPIAIGAATNLWSAIAPDWKASADVVAFTTGVINGLAAAVGCVMGGWFADRVSRWWAFFGAGVMMALVAVVMAIAPRTPAIFAVGVLLYAYTQGVANAAFSALALHATGRSTAAATKYALLGSLGNLPVSYMTAFDGWAYDRWSAAGMLNAEALLGVVCVALGLAALWRIRVAAPFRHPLDEVST